MYYSINTHTHTNHADCAAMSNSINIRHTTNKHTHTHIHASYFVLFVSHLRPMGLNVLGCQPHLQHSSASCLWSPRIFASLPGSSSTFFFIATQFQHTLTPASSTNRTYIKSVLVTHALTLSTTGARTKNLKVPCNERLYRIQYTD